MEDQEKMANFPILRFAYDLPNICTLLGLLSALAAIRFAILNEYDLAVFCGLWAVNFDFFDGMVARSLPNRSAAHRDVGGQLDSLVDVVHGGVLPALLLSAVGGFDLIYLLGAFVIVAATVLRLSYFNTFGSLTSDYFTGLPVYYNSLIVGVAFLPFSVMSISSFAPFLYVVIVLLALANVSPMQVPKQRGFLLYFLIGVTTGLSLAYLTLSIL